MIRLQTRFGLSFLDSVGGGSAPRGRLARVALLGVALVAAAGCAGSGGDDAASGDNAFSAATLPSIPNGTPYDKARTTLLAAGWLPFHARDADTCETGDARCTGRPEMVSCAGTGEADCDFLWINGGTQIEVFTINDPAVVSGLQTAKQTHQGAAVGGGGSAAAIPTFPSRAPYADARKTLLSAGWAPFHATSADTCQDGDDRCAGRPEMESCAGTGEADCIFLWQNGSTQLKVSTINDPPVVTSAAAASPPEAGSVIGGAQATQPSGPIPSATLDTITLYKVVTKLLNCRATPGTAGQVVQTIPQGTQVMAEDGTAARPRVASPNGQPWILVSTIDMATANTPACYASANFAFLEPLVPQH